MFSFPYYSAFLCSKVQNVMWLWQGCFKDRLWVVQSFWSIFYKKIMWGPFLFAFVTLVIYSHSLTVWLKLQVFTVKFENFRPPVQGGQSTQFGKTKNTVCLKIPHNMFWSPGFYNLVQVTPLPRGRHNLTQIWYLEIKFN